MAGTKSPRKSLPGNKYRRRRSSAISRKPTYAERLVGIIQFIRDERRQSHSNPKYKAPGCNNKNVVHRRSILKEAKRRYEANGDTFTVHDAKQFSRAEGDLAEAGVLQKISNTGHYRLAHSIEQVLDKSFKDLTTEEQSDPIIIGDIVRHATNQVDRKRSPSREPSASPAKRRRTSLAPRFATLEPEYSVPPPSTRGASQHPPPSQIRSMPPQKPRQSTVSFKRKTRNSTGGRIERLFEGSLSPPPDDDHDDEESTQNQLEQARSNITRLHAELERYKALLNGQDGHDQAPAAGSGEHSLGSIIPDSEESRTIIPSGNLPIVDVLPRSSIPYQSERQHPNRDLEEMDVTFASNDRPAPSSTHSSPVRPSVSAHGSFVNDPASSSSAPRRALGRTGSNRGMVVLPPHPTPPHTSDEDDDEEEDGGIEMNDSLFLGGGGASFDGVEDSYKVELSRHLAREEELSKRVEELENVAREKDGRVKELETQTERLQGEVDNAADEHKSSLQERDDRIAELEEELSRKAEELKDSGEKYHGDILALEVANGYMTSRTEALEAEKRQATQNVVTAKAEADAKAAMVVDLQGRLQVAEETAQQSATRVNELEQEVQEREGQLAEATTTIEDLRSRIEDLETKTADLRLQLNAVEDEKTQAALVSSNAITERDKKISDLQAKLEAEQLDLNDISTLLAARDTELASSQQQITNLEREVDAAELRIEQALQLAHESSTLNTATERNLAAATASVNELNGKVQLLETRLGMAVTEVARVSSELMASELQTRSLEEQLDATKLELGSAQAQLGEAQESKKRNEESLNGRIADLESQLSASANAHAQLLECIQSYQGQLAESRSAHNLVHGSLLRSRAQVEELQASLAEQSRELDELVDQATALVEDKAALESSLVHAADAIKNLERQVSKADRTVVRLSNDNHQLNVEKDGAMRDAEELKKQKASVEKKVENVLGRYAELKKKITVVQGFMGQAVTAVNDVEMAIDSPIA